MAEKNWLIRTKNKQILGPATKQKIIELIQKGSLTGEDEITSGNGYWFWIKENELLEKYIFGDEIQTFNPISEAEDVLTAGGRNVTIDPFLPSGKAPAPKSTVNKEAAKPKIEETLFPDDKDLEYPDLQELVSLQDGEDEAELDVSDLSEDTLEDITVSEIEDGKSGSLDLADLGGQIEEMKAQGQGQLLDSDSYNDEEDHLPSDEDLEYPDIGDGPALATPLPPEEVPEIVVEHNKTEEISIESIVPPARKPALRRKAKQFTVDDEGEEDDSIWDELDKGSDTSEANVGKQRNDKYLFLILILVFLLIAILFYYYKMVLNKPLPLVGISEAHAQSISSLPIEISKKKSSLSFKI